MGEMFSSVSSPFIVVGAQRVLVVIVVHCHRLWSLLSSIDIVVVVVCWPLSSAESLLFGHVLDECYCQLVIQTHRLTSIQSMQIFDRECDGKYD